MSTSSVSTPCREPGQPEPTLVYGSLTGLRSLGRVGRLTAAMRFVALS